MLVVCDTFNFEDYPVEVGPESDVREIAKVYDNRNMQKIMEVYNLSLPIETQLDEIRAMHYDPQPELAERVHAPITQTEAIYEQLKNVTYLGDGLYVSYDGYQVKLYAYNGINITNECYLDRHTLESFLAYLKKLGLTK
jgi:hypothetical protein